MPTGRASRKGNGTDVLPAWIKIVISVSDFRVYIKKKGLPNWGKPFYTVLLLHLFFQISVHLTGSQQKSACTEIRC